MKDSVYFLVGRDALPQVFTKVVQAKEYLRTGQAASTTEATKLAGISRSVFYKYKDAVYPYHGETQRQIVTVQVLLYDRPGVLLAVIAAFYNAGANLLTVNQNIPVNGTALVSISAQTDGLERSMEAVLQQLEQVDGVQRIEQIAG